MNWYRVNQGTGENTKIEASGWTSNGKLYVKGNDIMNSWASPSGNIIFPNEGTMLPGPPLVKLWTGKYRNYTFVLVS